MKLIAILFILLPIMAYSQNPNEDEPEAITADIDCDGKQDVAKITYQKSKLVLSVHLGASGKEQSLIFGLGSGDEQDSFCSTTIFLSKEAPESHKEDSDTSESETLLEGHIIQKDCVNLKLSDEMCDSIHVYWNHTTNQLDWWRL